VLLRRNSNALFLLQRVRDEAHRFAVSYHRTLRRKTQLRSVLDGIPGVGAERRRNLLRHFGSVKRVREAAAEDLATVAGISATLAARIRAALDATADGERMPGHAVRLRLEDLPDRRRDTPPDSTLGAEVERGAAGVTETVDPKHDGSG